MEPRTPREERGRRERGEEKSVGGGVGEGRWSQVVEGPGVREKIEGGRGAGEPTLSDTNRHFSTCKRHPTDIGATGVRGESAGALALIRLRRMLAARAHGRGRPCHGSIALFTCQRSTLIQVV